MSRALKILAGIVSGVLVVIAFLAVTGNLGGGDETSAADSNSQDGPKQASTPEGEPVRLRAPEQSPRCAVPSARILRGADLAFLGTVTSTSAGTIELSPEAVYEGSTGPIVFIDGASQELGPLVGTVPFEEETTYLVASLGEQVFVCGLTGVEDPSLTALYEKAFGEPTELESAS